MYFLFSNIVLAITEKNLQATITFSKINKFRNIHKHFLLFWRLCDNWFLSPKTQRSGGNRYLLDVKKINGYFTSLKGVGNLKKNHRKKFNEKTNTCLEDYARMETSWWGNTSLAEPMSILLGWSQHMEIKTNIIFFDICAICWFLLTNSTLYIY